jgi:hypothetical protein
MGRRAPGANGAHEVLARTPELIGLLHTHLEISGTEEAGRVFSN